MAQQTTLNIQCSPFHAQLTEHVHRYLSENWAFSSEKYKAAFFSMNFPRLVALCCPTGPPDRLTSASQFVSLTGLLDDAFSQMSLAEGRSLSKKLLQIMQGCASPDRSNPLERVVGDIIEAMTAQDERLAKDVFRGAVALFRAQTAKERLSIVHLDEYFGFRMKDVGGEFFTAVVRFVADVHLTDEQRVLFHDMEETCIRHLILANDILSWDKELKEAQESNEEGSALCSSVPLLARDLGLTYEAAKRVLWVSCRELEGRYREMAGEMRDSAHAKENSAVATYVEALGYLASGNEAWSRTTTRYQIKATQ